MGHQILIARTPLERELIYRFRYRIYIEEMQKYHLPADHNNKRLLDEADVYMVLYYATVNGELAGTVRSQRGTEGAFMKEDIAFYGIDEFENFFDHNMIAVVDRLIVDQRFRKSTLAHELMLQTYIDGWQSGTRMCFITCDDQLLPMYLRYGFRTYCKPAVLSSGDRRHKLILFLCDKAHLRKVRSPFLNYVPDELNDYGQMALLSIEKLYLELSDQAVYIN